MVDLKNINCFTFDKENDEYEEKLKNNNNNKLYIKEVIDNGKKIYFANGSKTINFQKFKSN